MPIDSARLLAWLLNATMQIVVLGAGTALALRLSAGRPARTRFRLAVAGLMFCAIVPWLSAWPHSEPGRGMVVVTTPINTRVFSDGGLAAAALWAYFAVLAWKTTAVARALAAARSLRRACTPTVDSAIAEAFDRFKRADRSLEIRQSPLAPSPLVCGVLRPTIIFPERFPTSDPTVVDSVLAHEYAHVVRRDIAMAMAIEVLTLPFAVHPVIAALKRAAARYREAACDEIAVIDLAVDQREYASALLRLAECPRGTSAFAATAGVHLETRIQHLLEPRHERHVRATGLLPCLTLLGSVTLAPWSAISVDAPWLQLAGSWRLDVEGSGGRSRGPFQSARVQIDVSGRDVRIVHDRTRANGRYEAFEIRGTADNEPFRVLLPGHATVHTRARWEGTRLITDSVGPGFRWRQHSELAVVDNRLVVRTENAYDERRARSELVFRKDVAQ